jgi:outer membrane protein OmpA-like peptidoglycan-associated protein
MPAGVALVATGSPSPRPSTRNRARVTPIWSNATPAGMRLNRRVEVTLLGERAERFDRED